MPMSRKKRGSLKARLDTGAQRRGMRSHTKRRRGIAAAKKRKEGEAIFISAQERRGRKWARGVKKARGREVRYVGSGRGEGET